MQNNSCNNRKIINNAVNQYTKDKISIGKAAEIADLTISEMIDLLSKLGIPSNLDLADYLEGQKFAEEII